MMAIGFFRPLRLARIWSLWQTIERHARLPPCAARLLLAAPAVGAVCLVARFFVAATFCSSARRLCRNSFVSTRPRAAAFREWFPVHGPPARAAAHLACFARPI